VRERGSGRLGDDDAPFGEILFRLLAGSRGEARPVVRGDARFRVGKARPTASLTAEDERCPEVGVPGNELSVVLP
jgi:hypothetical protein